MKQPEHSFKIAFFLSGSGSTLENLLEQIVTNKVTATVSVVISSKEGVYGIERAKNWGIPYHVVRYKEYRKDIEGYSSEILKILSNYPVDLIVFGGFMSKFLFDKKYQNKVVNVHPSLIPSFCGKGFYGEKVHQAVLDYGTKITGCTVHFVDEEYDHGPIIAQKAVPVLEDDTLETLSTRVVQAERELYPQTIQAIVENRIKVNNRKVTLLGSQ